MDRPLCFTLVIYLFIYYISREARLHVCLSVYVSVHRRIPTLGLLHGP